MSRPIKAISLWEPWATLVAMNQKQYETRSWPWNYRGEILICASKAGIKKSLLSSLLKEKAFRTVLGENPELNFGKAVAIATITGCIPTYDMKFDDTNTKYEKDFGDYSYGRFAIKLEDIKRIKNPFPVIGRQGFFFVELPEDVEFV